MKRLLTILFILFLTCPVMAQQVTTNRLLKDVSDLCESVIDTNHSTMDIFVCLANAFDNPYVWRPGWSEKETVDVIKSNCSPKTFGNNYNKRRSNIYTSYKKHHGKPISRLCKSI